MRSETDLLNTFLPGHEKDWEARLFVDKAIKNSVEYHVQTIAMALSGKHEIKIKPAHNNEFEKTEHIKGDDGQWIKVTKKYKYEARFSSYVIYGRNKIEIWLRIIDFWAGKTTVFPCGGAAHPNCKLQEELKTKTQ